MATKTLSVKIEDDFKDEVTELASELGVSVSTVVKAKLKEFVRTRTLTISLDEQPSKSLVSILRDVDNQEKSPEFNNVQDAVNWLNEK